MYILILSSLITLVYGQNDPHFYVYPLSPHYFHQPEPMKRSLIPFLKVRDLPQSGLVYLKRIKPIERIVRDESEEKDDKSMQENRQGLVDGFDKRIQSTVSPIPSPSSSTVFPIPLPPSLGVKTLQPSLPLLHSIRTDSSPIWKESSLPVIPSQQNSLPEEFSSVPNEISIGRSSTVIHPIVGRLILADGNPSVRKRTNGIGRRSGVTTWKYDEEDTKIFIE